MVVPSLNVDDPEELERQRVLVQEWHKEVQVFGHNEQAAKKLYADKKQRHADLKTEKEKYEIDIELQRTHREWKQDREARSSDDYLRFLHKSTPKFFEKCLRANQNVEDWKSKNKFSGH